MLLVLRLLAQPPLLVRACLFLTTRPRVRGDVKWSLADAWYNAITVLASGVPPVYGVNAIVERLLTSGRCVGAHRGVCPTLVT